MNTTATAAFSASRRWNNDLNHEDTWLRKGNKWTPIIDHPVEINPPRQGDFLPFGDVAIILAGINENIP